MIPLNREFHDFSPEHFGTLYDLHESRDSDECDTLLIACSDQGTAPDNVSFAHPGRFYILQHLVAAVPPADMYQPDMIAADIEYVLGSKDIQHIIVCGHLQCGIIRSFLTSEMADCSGLKEQFIEMAVDVLEQIEAGPCQDELIELLIREHVLSQIENLRTHSFIQDRLDSGHLQFHAWVVNDATARVHAYDARRGNFLPIEQIR